MSSTIEIVPFIKGHLLLLDVSGSDISWMPNPAEQLARQADAGFAYTMLVDKRVAAVGGVARIWPGLAEGWVVASPLARTSPVALTKAAIRGIAYTMQSLHLHRLQAHVKTSDKRAVRWAEFLGFKREGTLAKFGADGSDYDVYAMTR